MCELDHAHLAVRVRPGPVGVVEVGVHLVEVDQLDLAVERSAREAERRGQLVLGRVGLAIAGLAARDQRAADDLAERRRVCSAFQSHV